MIRKGYGLLMTVPARFGRLSVATAGEALVVRRETVLFSDIAGQVTPVVREGERVPRGALVLRVVPPGGNAREDRRWEEALDEAGRRAILDEQSPLRAGADAPGRRGASDRALASVRRTLEEERAALARRITGREKFIRASAAGTVSFTVDGLEGVLGPDGLTDLLEQPELVAGLVRGVEPRTVEAGDEVVPGGAVAKIVDNFQVWFVVDLPRDEAWGALPSVGGRVRIRPQGMEAPGGASCKAVVTARRDHPGGTRLILAPVEFWPEFGQLRRTTLEVLLGDFEGVVVPRTALVKRGEVTGVAVETWRGRQFQAVTVRGGDRDRVVVDGLAAGTRVWRDPEPE